MVQMLLVALTLSLATSAAAQPLSGPEFIPLATPCRALDTRLMGTPLQANVPTPIQIGGVTTGGANCGVPTTAAGAALNFTIAQPQGPGWLTAWSTGALPLTSVVNYVAGESVANAVDIGLGAGGMVIVQSIAATHLVVDIYGYFTDVEELAGGNTALGANALASITTGVANTALGAGALGSNSTGNSNTATGVAALTTNITGSNNTATGFQALFSNTIGINNTATGLAALSNNTIGINNTATGLQALLSNTTGNSNTATGLAALGSNTTGSFNTATGSRALLSNTTGVTNTAVGFGALASNTTGGDNTATGQGALGSNTTGEDNTALGVGALNSNTTGNSNIAIGIGAGAFVTTGSNNIYIGNLGSSLESATNDTIRIGSQGTNPFHTRTFIAGIFGATVLGGSLAVVADNNGQLGTAISSRRAKDDIRDMDDASAGLGKLRPVTFRYKAEPATAPRSIEYGLIAEEVAEIYPELVVLDKDGQPSGVRYHVLPAMLLNELQRQQRDGEARFATQQREIDELRAQVRALIDGRKAAAQQ